MFSPATPYVLTLLVTALLCGAIFTIIWRYRHRNSSVILFSIAWLACFLWAFGYALQVGSSQLAAKLFWFYFTHIGIVLFPISVFVVTLQYVGREQWFTPRRLVYLTIIPIGMLIFIWSNPLHQLFMSDLHIETNVVGFNILVGQREIGFWLVYALGYLIVVSSVAFALQVIFTMSGIYRAQLGALLLGTVPVLIANLLFLLGVTPFPDFNLTPYTFLSMGLSFALGYRRYQLLEVTPVGYDTIINNMSDGVVVLNAKAVVVNFNAAAQRITPQLEWISGVHISNYLPDWDSLLKESITAISRPQEVVFHHDELPHYYELHISPLYDNRGSLTGRLVLLHNITERKQIEQAHLRQNEYMEALHETSLGLMQRLNLSELLTDLLERAGQLLDAPHGYIYLGDVNNQRLKLEVGRGHFETFVGERIGTETGLAGKVWRTGYPLLVANYDSWPDRAPDFEKGVLGAMIAIPLNSGGEIVGVIGLAREVEAAARFGNEELEFFSRFAQLGSIILDNANLYMEAQVARAAAETANEAKGNFLANVSHELRTPLTSIIGFTRMIQKRFEDRILPEVKNDERKVQRAIEHIRMNIDIVLKEGERLSALINDVLDLEKIEAGKMEWHFETVTVDSVIERVLSMTLPLFQQKGLKQKVEVETNLPPIYGDRDQLHQVMINLVSNAVKFTDNGSVACRARLINDMIEISVADTGIGIAQEDLPRVFDKFTQLGNTLTDKPKGTGLGLSICRYIVEKHGGEIWLTSKEGLGTTFFFTLPIMVTKDDRQK